jgi:hypothetical protein
MSILERINNYFSTIDSVGHIDTAELDEFANGIRDDYRKFWKKLEDGHSPFEEMTYHEHVHIIQAISNIENIVSEVGLGNTLYTEDTIKESVEESLRDNYYDFIDNIESGSWPYSYAEFDIEGAISEAVENASEYSINDIVLFQEVDVYSIY